MTHELLSQHIKAMLFVFQSASIKFHRRAARQVRDVSARGVPQGGSEAVDADYYWMLRGTECRYSHVGYRQSVCWGSC